MILSNIRLIHLIQRKSLHFEKTRKLEHHNVHVKQNLKRTWGLPQVSSLRRLCFTHVCHSFHRGMVVVSQHALQVSRPTPMGEVERSGLGGLQAHIHGGSLEVWPGGSPGPHPWGKFRGLAWGVSRHTPRGSPSPQPEGFHAYTKGWSPDTHLGGIPACTKADTSHQMATDAGGMHPPSMHSCSIFMAAQM